MECGLDSSEGGAFLQAVWHSKPLLVQVLLDMVKNWLARVLPAALWPSRLLGANPRG